MKTVVPAPSFPEKWFKVLSKQEARFFPNYSTEELHQETEYGLVIAVKSTQTGFVRSIGMSLQTVQISFPWISQPLQAYAPFIQYLYPCCKVLALTQLQTWALIKTFQVVTVQIALCCDINVQVALNLPKENQKLKVCMYLFKST